MTAKISLRTQIESESEIIIERGIFSKTGEKADFIFTDSNVYALYQEEIKKAFPNTPVWAMPAGEENKTEETLFALLAKMKEAQLHRGDTLVTLGGGVAGDIGGLAAALYMRGISCIQIPTTLLAQVDSSVGGKTAIDFGGVKNLIGAFAQPKKVFIDCDFLKTLPPREIRCGLGEIIKHGALSEEIFELLIKNKNLLFDLDFLSEAVPQNIAFKADIVRNDPNEKGIRKCLNLGHTTAHAFELSGANLSHGECVLVGILFEAEIAKRVLSDMEAGYLDELEELALTALGGMPSLPDPCEAVRAARLDKKNQTHDKVFLTLPAGRGKYAFYELTFEQYGNYLKEIGEKLC